MRRGETVFHPLLPVRPVSLRLCLLFLSKNHKFLIRSTLSLKIVMQFVYVWEDGHLKIKLCVFNLMCLLGSSVVAENDFLHTLLNKVTASRGDSGGQGTDPHKKWLFRLALSPLLCGKIIMLMDSTHTGAKVFMFLSLYSPYTRPLSHCPLPHVYG